MTGIPMEYTDVANWDDEEQANLRALGWSYIGQRDGRLIYWREKENHS